MTQHRRCRSIRLVSRSRFRSPKRYDSRRSVNKYHWTKHRSKFDIAVRHNHRYSRSSNHRLRHVRLQNTYLKGQLQLIELDKRCMEKEIRRLYTLLQHDKREPDKHGMNNKSHEKDPTGKPHTSCKDHVKHVAALDDFSDSSILSKSSKNIATQDGSNLIHRNCTWRQLIPKMYITGSVKKSPIMGRYTNDELDNTEDLQLNSDDLLMKRPHQCATNPHISSELTYADSGVDQEHKQNIQSPYGIYVEQALRQ